MKFFTTVCLFLIYCNQIFASAQTYSFIKDSDLKIYKVTPFDRLDKILERHGFSTEAIRKATYDKQLRYLSFLPEIQYLAAKNKDYNFIKFYEPFNSISHLVLERGGRLTVEQFETEFDIKKVESKGKITGPLFESIKASINSDIVAFRFSDVFSLDYNLVKVLKRDAEFSMKVEKKFDHGKFIKYGEILNASLNINGKQYNKSFVRYEGGGVHFSNDVNYNKRPFFAPVTYVRISSPFQPRRKHPITKRVISHNGMDLEMPQGTPLYAPANGTVDRMGHKRAPGNYIVIRHSSGLETYYNHLESINKKLMPGSRVSAGQYIGNVGCTGYCTKPHLHFAVKKYSNWVDPSKLIKPFTYAERTRFESFASNP